jgi:hypothetical protein
MLVWVWYNKEGNVHRAILDGGMVVQNKDSLPAVDLDMKPLPVDCSWLESVFQSAVFIFLFHSLAVGVKLVYMVHILPIVEHFLGFACKIKAGMQVSLIVGNLQ